jgi:hypothetical protein
MLDHQTDILDFEESGTLLVTNSLAPNQHMQQTDYRQPMTDDSLNDLEA